MTLTEDQTATLEAATFTTRTAKSLYDNARQMREREIRNMARDGGTYREIAEITGIAYQRVAQIVSGKKPPTRDQYDHLEHKCPKCGARPGIACEGKARSQAHIERYHVAIEAFREQHPELG